MNWPTRLGLRRNSPRDWLGWTAAGFLVALSFALLVRYAVNFPYADDFSQLLAVPILYPSGGTFAERVSYIVSLSVEHRIATLRLAALAQAKLLGGLNFVYLMAVGWAMLVCSAALVVWSTEHPYRPLLAATAAALLFSPANYEAQYWATGALQHFGVIAFAFGAIFCLRREGVGRSVAALGLALAAAFTSANGLMTFPAVALALWASGRRREAISWCVVAVCLFALYFTGYERPDFQTTALGTLIEPLRLIRFFLMAVGSIAIYPLPSLAFGSTLVGTWAWLLFRYRTSVPPVFLGWFAFLALSSAAMAVGRANFGDQGALLSRYRVYSEMATVVTLAVVLHGISPRYARRLLWTAVPVALVWFAASWHTNVSAITHAALLQQVRLDESAAFGYSNFGPWPPAAHGGFLLRAAGERGYYDVKRIATPPPTAIGDARKLSSSGIPGLRIDHLVQSGNAVSVFGFVDDQQEQISLWLGDSVYQYRATLASRPMGFGLFGRGGFNFWGTVIVTGLEPGLYRVGFSLGDSPLTAFHWTDELVLVGFPLR